MHLLKEFKRIFSIFVVTGAVLMVVFVLFFANQHSDSPFGFVNKFGLVLMPIEHQDRSFLTEENSTQSTVVFDEDDFKNKDYDVIAKNAIFLRLFPFDGQLKEYYFLSPVSSVLSNLEFSLHRVLQPETLVSFIKKTDNEVSIVLSSPKLGGFKNYTESIGEKILGSFPIPAEQTDPLFVIDNSIISLGESAVGNTLGNVQGESVSIFTKTRNNILNADDSSFEKTINEDVGDCSNQLPGEPKLIQKLSNDASDRSHSLLLSSQNHYACVSRTFPVDLQNDKLYRFAFDYKNIVGNDVRYYYRFSAGSRIDSLAYSKAGDMESSDTKWHTFVTVINPDNLRKNYNNKDLSNVPAAGDNNNDLEGIVGGEKISTIKYLTVYFYAPSDGTKEVTNLYDNLRLSEYSLADVRKIDVAKLVGQDDELAKNVSLNIGQNDIHSNLEGVNLLSQYNPSFEGGSWTKDVADCSNQQSGKPIIDMSLSKDSSDGKNAISLKSSNHNACTFKAFPVSLSNGKYYRLSFDYQSLKGGDIQFFYKLVGSDNDQIYSKREHVDIGGWHTYETVINPTVRDVSEIDVVLYANSDGSKDSNVLYDNIRLVEALPKDVGSYYFYTDQQVDQSRKLAGIEWRSVNPWKNRVVLHGVKDSFLLIYPEEYNERWRVFPYKRPEDSALILPVDYFVSKIDSNRQATKNELRNYIKNGLVSVVGNKFISKNFNGSIRNDNLSSGGLFEALGKPQVSEKNHYKVNNFNNAWWIDVGVLCKQQNFCIQNTDGTYDVALIIENSFNRYIEFGFLFSVATLFGYMLVLGFQRSLVRRKKEEKNGTALVVNGSVGELVDGDWNEHLVKSVKHDRKIYGLYNIFVYAKSVVMHVVNDVFNQPVYFLIILSIGIIAGLWVSVVAGIFLTVLLIFLFYQWESRVVTMGALLALALCPVLFSLNLENAAEQSIVYSYLFLLSSLVLWVSEYVRKQGYIDFLIERSTLFLSHKRFVLINRIVKVLVRSVAYEVLKRTWKPILAIYSFAVISAFFGFAFGILCTTFLMFWLYRLDPRPLVVSGVVSLVLCVVFFLLNFDQSNFWAEQMAVYAFSFSAMGAVLHFVNIKRYSE